MSSLFYSSLKKSSLVFLCVIFGLKGYAQIQDAYDIINKPMEVSIERNGKTLFKGQIHKGKKNGMGTLLYQDKRIIYVGDFSSGKISGFGMEISSNWTKNCDSCVVYVGGWEDGKKCGSGICYNSSGMAIYNGSFDKDKPTQQYPIVGMSHKRQFSIIEIKRGSYYIGEISNGLPDGFGTIIFSSGDMWQSRFKAGKRNGIGLYIYYDGAWETLNYKNDDLIAVVSSSEEYEHVDSERKNNRRKFMATVMNEMLGILQEAAILTSNVVSVTTQHNVSSDSGNSNSNAHDSNKSQYPDSESHKTSEVQSMQTDRRTYSSWESQLIKMNTYYETDYNNSQRLHIQQQMKSIRKKWESRGFNMYHSEWEDWDGNKK